MSDADRNELRLLMAKRPHGDRTAALVLALLAAWVDLRHQNRTLANRVAAQAELLAQKAEGTRK